MGFPHVLQGFPSDFRLKLSVSRTFCKGFLHVSFSRCVLSRVSFGFPSKSLSFRHVLQGIASGFLLKVWVFRSNSHLQRFGFASCLVGFLSKGYGSACFGRVSLIMGFLAVNGFLVFCEACCLGLVERWVFLHELFFFSTWQVVSERLTCCVPARNLRNFKRELPASITKVAFVNANICQWILLQELNTLHVEP